MLATAEAYGFVFAFPAGDMAVGACLRDYGEFARVSATLAGQLVQGGAFVDVGANIGALTLPVARRARQVIAIEAHAGLADLLSRNVTANGLSNVEVIHAAAGPAPGEALFPTPPLDWRTNFGRSSFAGEGPAEPVKVVPLDSVAPVDTRVVKIDVEGHEEQVMAGAARLLRTVRPSWIVEADRDTAASRRLIRTFLDERYRVHWLWDPFVTGRATRKRWVGPYRGDLNILATPLEGQAPMGMVAAAPDGPWPTSTSGFDYLRAFGIEPRDAAR